MPVFSFACPYCSAPLRLKDRNWIGRTIDCPDCGQPVAIREDSASGVVGQPTTQPASVSDATERQSVHEKDAGPTDGNRRLAGWVQTVTSPLVVSWVVAAGLSVGLIGWLVGVPVAQTQRTSDASTNEPPAQSAGDSVAFPESGEAGGDETALLPGHAEGSINAEQGPREGGAPGIVPAEVFPDDPGPNGPPHANPFGIAEVAPEIAGRGDRPIEVPLFEGPMPVDIAAALNQPIARFDQSTAVSARQLLRSIEEMAAVVIETDDLPEDAQSRLDRPVSLTLSQTTVAGILVAILEQLELSYEVRGDRITLVVPIEID